MLIPYRLYFTKIKMKYFRNWWQKPRVKYGVGDHPVVVTVRQVAASYWLAALCVFWAGWASAICNHWCAASWFMTWSWSCMPPGSREIQASNYLWDPFFPSIIRFYEHVITCSSPRGVHDQLLIGLTLHGRAGIIKSQVIHNKIDFN